jgi:molybdopterin synthase catalytic subunit
MIALTDQPISILEVIEAAQSEQAGAVDVFIGTVRNYSLQKKVIRLEYEAYDKMALKVMEQIVEEVKAKWPVQNMAMVHRKGVLQIGEVAVVVAVSTPHRRESFEACQYTIDTLKQRVPIWKKEFYENGETWVAAHP